MLRFMRIMAKIAFRRRCIANRIKVHARSLWNYVLSIKLISTYLFIVRNKNKTKQRRNKNNNNRNKPQNVETKRIFFFFFCQQILRNFLVFNFFSSPGSKTDGIYTYTVHIKRQSSVWFRSELINLDYDFATILMNE